MERTMDEKQLRSARSKVKTVKFFLSSEFMAVMFIVAISLITFVINPKFFTGTNILLMLRNCAFIGIMSIGQALIIMSGEMDLSTAAVGGFSSVIFGMLCIWDVYPIWFGLLVAAFFACAMGFLNGFLMLKVGVMKWVATLATSSFCGGLGAYLSLGVPITPMPDALGDFAAIQVGNGVMTWLFGGTNRNMGLSILFIIFVALLIIAHIILRYTKYGRMIQASGISANSAYMAGVNVTRVKWITLVFVSLLSFIATFFSCMRQRVVFNGGLSNFKSIAACYIGGIGFVGSTGSMFGLFLGVILMALIENAMSAIGWDPNVQIAVVGLMLMIVLTVDVFKRRYIASRIDLI